MPAPSPPLHQPAEDAALTRRDWLSLWAVLVVQAQNAFNDNFVKFVLIGLAMVVAQGTLVGDRIEHLLSALIPLPFILLAPLAGYFSDRFSKRQVIVLCLVGQLAIFAFIAASVALRAIPLAVFGFFLLAVQSTLFSPAKQGILKELVGSRRLGFANGFLQMLTMVGIIAGMWLGGLWFDHLLQGYNAEGGGAVPNAWRAALIPILAIGASSLVPLALCRLIVPTPSHPDTRFSARVWTSHFGELSYLFADRRIRSVALLISFYWLVANFLALTMVGFARELFPDVAGGGTTSASSRMMAFVGVGLMLGSVAVSLLSRKRVRRELAALGGLGMALGLAGIGFLPPGGGLWQASLGFTGFSSGFFLIPLAATLQDLPEESRRGRVLAAANLLSSLSGVLAIALSFGLRAAGLNASLQAALFIPPMLLAAFRARSLALRLREA